MAVIQAPRAQAQAQAGVKKKLTARNGCATNCEPGERSKSIGDTVERSFDCDLRKVRNYTSNDNALDS